MSDNDPYAQGPEQGPGGPGSEPASGETPGGWPGSTPPVPPPGGSGYPPPSYGQSPYGPGPYGQPAYGPGGYGSQPYGVPQPPSGGYGPRQQMHPNATTALILGLVALIGSFLCCLPAVLGPGAWYLGAKASKEIRQNPQMWRGSGEAKTGLILGVISSVLGILMILLFVFLFALGVFADSGSDWSEVSQVVFG